MGHAPGPTFEPTSLDQDGLADTAIIDTSMHDSPPPLLSSAASHSALGSTPNPNAMEESFQHSPMMSPNHSAERSVTPPPPVISSELAEGPNPAFRMSRFHPPPPLLSSTLDDSLDTSFRPSRFDAGPARGSASTLSASPPPPIAPLPLPGEDSYARQHRLSTQGNAMSPMPHGISSISPPYALGRDRYSHLLRRPSDEPNGREQPANRDEPMHQSWSSNRLSSGSEVSGDTHPHTHRPSLLPRSRFTYETPRLAGDKRVLRSAATGGTASALRPTRATPWSTTQTRFRAQRVPMYVDPEEGRDKENDNSTDSIGKENKPSASTEETAPRPEPPAQSLASKVTPDVLSMRPDSPPNRNPLAEVKTNSIASHGPKRVLAKPEPRSGSHLPGYELGAGAEEDEADNEDQPMSAGPRQPSSAPALGSSPSRGMRVSSAGVAEQASTSAQPNGRTALAARAVSQPPAMYGTQPPAPPPAAARTPPTLESLPIEEATAVLAQTPEQDKFVLYEREVLKEAVRQASYNHARISSWLGKAAGKDWKDFKPTTVNGLKYRKIRKAGEGGFSTVWVVRGPFERVDTKEEYAEHQQAFFAMKQVNLKKLEPQSREDVLKEAEHLEALSRHPGYDQYMLRYFAHKANDSHLKILIELGDCDFSDILRRQQLDRWDIPKVFGQMCDAVHFLHKAGIVHTDLKPANFLRAGDSIKIIDLGIAQKIPKGTIHISREALVGTPNYMAPETVKMSRKAADAGGGGPRPALFKAGIASDVWAMGCILYQLVYGRPPFDKLMGEAKLRTIVSEKTVIDYPPTRPPTYPAQPGDEGELVDDMLLDAMKSMLQYQVDNRATLPSTLDHPFMAPYSRASEHAAVSREMMYMFFTRVRDLERAGRIIPGTEVSMVENFFQKMPKSLGPAPQPSNPPS